MINKMVSSIENEATISEKIFGTKRSNPIEKAIKKYQKYLSVSIINKMVSNNEATISEEIFGAKRGNPVKLKPDRKRKVWCLLLYLF